MKNDALVQRALSLLSQPIPKPKPGTSGIADALVIEPAAENARPIYWERADLSIVGPGRPEFLAQVGTGATERFWVIVEFQGQPFWVQSNQLRSRKAFEQQPKVHEVQSVATNGL